MRSLRVPVQTLTEGDQTLDSEASHYVLSVHRLRPGDALVLFDPILGLEAAGTLLRATSKAAVCRLDTPQPSRSIPHGAITLIQAVAKGDKPDRVISDATALGVASIVFVQTSRSVVRQGTGEPPERQRRWQRIAIDAARQSGRGNIPTILGPVDFEASIAEVSNRSLRILLSPYASVRLRELLTCQAPQPTAIFVGPEGGLSDEEQATLIAARFTPVRFGDFTLRTELCASAVLGAMLDWTPVALRSDVTGSSAGRTCG